MAHGSPDPRAQQGRRCATARHVLLAVDGRNLAPLEASIRPLQMQGAPPRARSQQLTRRVCACVALSRSGQAPITRYLSCQLILGGRCFGAWGVGTFGLDWGWLCATDRRIPLAVDGRNLAPLEALTRALQMRGAPLAHPELNIGIVVSGQFEKGVQCTKILHHLIRFQH